MKNTMTKAELIAALESAQKRIAELEFEFQQQTTMLTQTNTLFETLLEYTPDQIYFKDAESRFIKNSKSQARALGLKDSAEVVGKTDFDFFPHAQRSYDEEQEIIRSGKPFVDFEEQVMWPDGTETWVSTTKAPLRDQSGEIIGTFGISRDITVRKRAEESLRKAKEELELKVAERTSELKESNEQLQFELGERKRAEEALRLSHQQVLSFIEQAPLSIAMFDKNMNYLATSRRWIVEYGRGYANLIGRNHYDVHADVPDIWKDAHQRGLLGESIKNDDDLWVQADGTKNWLKWAITPWMDENGKIGGIIISAEDISEHKQAEEALRKSQKQLNGIILSAMDAVISVDSQQLIILFNAAAEKMFGCLASEAMGKPLDNFIPDRFHAVHREHIRIFGETRVTNRTMNALGIVFGLRTNGEEFPIEASISQIEIDDKKIYTVILRDITKRKQAEESLKESEERFSTAFFTTPVAQSIIAQGTNKIMVVNDACCRLFEYSREELIGASTATLNLWENPAERSAAVEELQRTNRLLPRETTVQVKSGKIHTVIVAIEPILWKGIPCLISSVIDITERKWMEDALRQSEQKYSTLFEKAAIPAALTKLPENVFADVNHAFEKMFGYPKQEVIGKTSLELGMVRPEEHAQTVIDIQQYGSIHDNEKHIFTKSGDMRIASINVSAVEFSDQKYTITTLLDITERKRAEEELRRSNAELEQFAYVASHDLQEPLRAVAGMVQLLGQRYKGKLDERADEYINLAVEASGRMQNLINDLLEYSRVDRFGKPFEQTNLGSCLQLALANLQVAIKESNAQIIQDSLPTVMADQGQIVQLLQNLIGNAIKFRGERPLQIHIGAIKEADAWQIKVSDNGIGIEPQYFERIFLVFQRLHTRREYPGTGIGLALCKKIIERHHGNIWLESQPGQGTTFYFTLPEKNHEH